MGKIRCATTQYPNFCYNSTAPARPGNQAQINMLERIRRSKKLIDAFVVECVCNNRLQPHPENTRREAGRCSACINTVQFRDGFTTAGQPPPSPPTGVLKAAPPVPRPLAFADAQFTGYMHPSILHLAPAFAGSRPRRFTGRPLVNFTLRLHLP
jgi:hypothetical protein